MADLGGKLEKFELDRNGVKALLKSSEMQSILAEYGNMKAMQAGEGYVADVHVGQNRAYCNIHPDTKEAYNDNLTNNTLEKVIRS